MDPLPDGKVHIGDRTMGDSHEREEEKMRGIWHWLMMLFGLMLLIGIIYMVWTMLMQPMEEEYISGESPKTMGSPSPSSPVTAEGMGTGQGVST